MPSVPNAVCKRPLLYLSVCLSACLSVSHSSPPHPNLPPTPPQSPPLLSPSLSQSLSLHRSLPHAPSPSSKSFNCCQLTACCYGLPVPSPTRPQERLVEHWAATGTSSRSCPIHAHVCSSGAVKFTVQFTPLRHYPAILTDRRARGPAALHSPAARA